MRMYTKTVALVLLIGGFAVYNVIVDSNAVTAVTRELATLNPDMTMLELQTRRLNGAGCTPPAEPKGLAAVYGLGVLYLFIALAIIADDFFCPALDVIADWLHLSPDVSGATLMAAGASSPELFTSAVGTFLRSDVGFGTIVGSAVFNLLFVVGVCILATSVPMKLTWWPLMRDSAYYILTLVVLAIFFGVNSPQIIEWYEALILFLLYFL
jgi:small-conductance mechanosensitive channel